MEETGNVFRKIRCPYTALTIFAVLTSTYNLYYSTDIGTIMYSAGNPTLFLYKGGFTGVYIP